MKKSSVRPSARKSGTLTKVVPTGKCWCGCRAEVAENAFFLPGHDRIAESEMVKSKYGTLVDMLAAHDLGDMRRKVS